MRVGISVVGVWWERLSRVVHKLWHQRAVLVGVSVRVASRDSWIRVGVGIRVVVVAASAAVAIVVGIASSAVVGLGVVLVIIVVAVTPAVIAVAMVAAICG